MSEFTIKAVRRIEPLAILQVRNGVFWIEDGKGRTLSPSKLSSGKAWSAALDFLNDGGSPSLPGASG